MLSVTSVCLPGPKVSPNCPRYMNCTTWDSRTISCPAVLDGLVLVRVAVRERVPRVIGPLDEVDELALDEVQDSHARLLSAAESAYLVILTRSCGRRAFGSAAARTCCNAIALRRYDVRTTRRRPLPSAGVSRSRTGAGTAAAWPRQEREGTHAAVWCPGFRRPGWRLRTQVPPARPTSSTPASSFPRPTQFRISRRTTPSSSRSRCCRNWIASAPRPTASATPRATRSGSSTSSRARRRPSRSARGIPLNGGLLKFHSGTLDMARAWPGFNSVVRRRRDHPAGRRLPAGARRRAGHPRSRATRPCAARRARASVTAEDYWSDRPVPSLEKFYSGRVRIEVPEEQAGLLSTLHHEQRLPVAALSELHRRDAVAWRTSAASCTCAATARARGASTRTTTARASSGA